MATRKCGNIFFRNILWLSESSQILVSRDIFVVLLILIVGSRVCVCVCVCVFIKLHITAQSGLVILVILCPSH